MTKYAKHVSTKVTPQSEPIPGSAQVKNSAGGYAFAVDDWTRLDRFLILGSEGGSYYATERKLAQENSQALLRLLQTERGLEIVSRIVKVSDEGRAPKNDPAIFALATCLKKGDLATRRAAADAVPKVCRIGTHIFQLAECIEALGGWGRGTKRAVAAWYRTQTLEKLAYNLVKYRQRGGWSHRDLLRLAHVQAPQHEILFRWVTASDNGIRQVKRPQGVSTYPATGTPLPEIVCAFEEAQTAQSANEIARLIQDHNLPREAIPTKWLNELEVWESLLYAGKGGMPLTALIRNLGKMTSLDGLLAPGSQNSKYVCDRLADDAALRAARVHPMALLLAQGVYKSGHGVKGALAWNPVPRIVDALDGAFYKAFPSVETTGKSYMLALDVSGSMSIPMGNSALTCREASAAMALVTAATELDHLIVGFSVGLSPLDITPRQRLSDAVKKISGLPFEGTDCALPMLYALRQQAAIDVFVVYTDSETWYGEIHPVQALRQYREAMGINAKLVVVGMISNGFTIADPDDKGMLDVVGFDTNVPTVMTEFAKQ
jgi:60 kDa SS-A/Ro ribonucleoprotein